MSEQLKNEVFLNKLFNINSSYKERFCYEQCVYTGVNNKIKIKCKKHNCLFEIAPSNHLANAKKEIKKNIILGGCSECYSLYKKNNIYQNNEENLPENYNENDWKIIKYFENYYINNKGDIWSKSSNKYIKSYVNDDGYLIATLYNINMKGNSKKRVHILVAELFVYNPKPELYNIVNHIDGNRANPVYTNLEWTDRKGNAIHSRKNPENYKKKK